MSGDEADLVDDEGLHEDYYLDELVARAPSVDLLIRDVSKLHLFQGFITYATPDDDVKPHQLSKSEVEAMVNRDLLGCFGKQRSMWSYPWRSGYPTKERRSSRSGVREARDWGG